MDERVSTIEIYDILVKKNETTFYANDVALKIKLEYETLTAYYNEKPIAYISNLGGFNSIKASRICDKYENCFVFGYRVCDENMKNKGVMSAFVGHIHKSLNNHFSSYVSVIHALNVISENVATKNGFVAVEYFYGGGCVFVKSNEHYCSPYSSKNKMIMKTDLLSKETNRHIVRSPYVKNNFINKPFPYIQIYLYEYDEEQFRFIYNNIVQRLSNIYGAFYLFLRLHNKKDIAGFEHVPNRFLRAQGSEYTLYKCIDNTI